MTDHVSKAGRSRIMRAVSTKNTGPEKVLRAMLSREGYRYRLHRRDLPGTPDIVFPGKRKVIFVNGCFWHSHGCRKGRPPKSKLEFWGPKLAKNCARDKRNKADLRLMGWAVLTIWQCQTRNPDRLSTKLFSFLGPPGKNPTDNRRLNR
jgi:DNA mismatch endonuclease, patch repair protein